MKTALRVACLFLSQVLLSQATIDAMFYNILDFPTAPPSDREELLKNILSGYQPDLFMVCELTSEEGANSILSTSLATSDNRYQQAEFISNQSNPNVGLQQMVFFNSQKLALISQKVIPTHLRDINRYTFILKAIDQATDPVYLEVFVTHLKSSEGASNQQQRYEMVQDFTTSLLEIPTDRYVLFAGDLNLYTGQEEAYQELLDPSNAIVFVDPIGQNGKWHNNEAYQKIHTQATRSEPIGSHGAGGGIDDRFDFILVSENLINGSQLHYVSDSYKAYGNNGNCYNLAVNDPSCTGFFPQDLRNKLHEMSDHLPVVLQLRSDKTLSIEHEIQTSSWELTAGNLIEHRLDLRIDASLLGKTLTIYNPIGQRIVERPIQKTQFSIDATQLQNGIYYISIFNSNLSPLKFVKR